MALLLGALVAVMGAGCAVGTNLSLPHEASNLEALLPARVAGRPLIVWSMRGDRWLAMQTDSAIRARVESVLYAGGADLAGLRYGIAERSNTQDDPPYLVHVMWRPPGAIQGELAPLLFSGSVRFRAGFGPQTSSLESRTVGGKQVLVGTPEMLVQDEEQVGRPYLYEAQVGTDAFLFLVVTDSESWAAEALSALP